MKVLLALVLLLLAVPAAQAQRVELRWTRGNLTWGLGATAGIAADCISTRAVLSQPDFNDGGMFRRRYVETNPFLGPRPSAGHLNTVCGLTIVGAWGVGHLLPTKGRKYWFGAIALLEAGATILNLSKLR